MRGFVKKLLLTTSLSIIFSLGLFKSNATAAEQPKCNVSFYYYETDAEPFYGPIEVDCKDKDHPTTYPGTTFAEVFANTEVYKNLKHIVNGYSISGFYYYDGSGNRQAKLFSQLMTKSATHFSKDTDFYATYDEKPVEYPINYVLNGGTLPSSAKKSYNVTSSYTFPKPTKKDCDFEGWYLDAAFSIPFPSIASGTWDDYNLDGTIPSITIYAKWKNIKPSLVTIKSITNASKGKASVKFSSLSKAEGCELVYSTTKKFTSNVHTLSFAPVSKYTISGLRKGTYYFKVRFFNTSSTGVKSYSKYSAVKSVKISKGVAVYTPKSNSATLKSVKATTKNITVKATLKKRLKSYDDFYYLVKVDPITNAYHCMVASADKTNSLSFKLPLSDSKGNNYIEGKYAIAVKTSKSKYMIISSAAFVSNPEAAATYKASYPKPASKKGRQGIYVPAEGDRNYFNNLDINSIISTKSAGGEAFKYNGKTYYFKTTWLDDMISTVNRNGGTVTMQIMLKYNSKNKKLIKASGRNDTSKNYYAFNVEDAASRNQIEAAFMWLAQHWGKADCHVDNWILGNEVNTFRNPIGWYWAGNIGNDEFVQNYAQTFRILYTAVVSHYKNARVFTCVDHTFNSRDYDWGSKDFMAAFNTALKGINKNIKWNLAYHAYSAVLTNADFWNDNTRPDIYTVNDSYSTQYVTPLNLEVLVKYVNEKFGKNVHIILSEQAFSSSGGSGELASGHASGEDVQAAAVAYLFYKAMFNDRIDAVIYAHPYDNLGQGMDFALKGPASSVYKYMDTPSFATYTTSCLGTIGRSYIAGKKQNLSWGDIVPKFDASKLKSMPSR